MPRRRSWRRLRPELIYGFEPEELSRIFKDAGFAFFPKPGGPNVVVFSNPAQAEGVASATGLSIERDDRLLQASLYRERGSGEVMPSNSPGRLM